MKTFVVSSSCWKILLFLSIHRDQITNSTSVCSPFICWFESIVNWVNQACKSWSAVQLVGEREGQVAHADTKVQTYLEYEHSATKWKAVSKTRRFLLHSWKPTRCKLFMSHGFRFRNILQEPMVQKPWSMREEFTATVGTSRVWDQARITSKRKLRWAQCTVQRFRGREKLLSNLREEFILASNSN